MSCSTLGLLLSLPVPLLASWRKAQRGCLLTSKQNSRKNLVCIRGMHQGNCKRKWIRPPPCFFSSLSLPLLLFTPVLDHPCGRTNAVPKDWWYFSLSLFSVFISVLPFFACGKNSYHILRQTPYWSLLLEWGACGSLLWFVPVSLKSSVAAYASTFEK